MGLMAVSIAGFIWALACPALHRVSRRLSGWAVALLPAVLFGYLVSWVPRVAAGDVVVQSLSWVPSLDLALAFRLDGLSLTFALLITGIGALIAVYAGGYLAGHERLGQFYAYLMAFMAAMLGLVLAENLLALFVFWELTGVASYLLIGFESGREAARRAALQALLVTGAGGLALLAGFLLVGHVGGSMSLVALSAASDAITGHGLYPVILLLVLAGAFTKSAQFPFHFWLPNAMQAPTPASAYLHAATMVKAGVYLLARLNPVMGGTDLWHYAVTLAGAVTMLFGAVMALPQTDLKRLLAYSTVSALGTLVLLLGLSTEAATKAAMVFLVVHSLYKGALFMVAGSVDHETGTRDLGALGGLYRAMPITAAASGLAALSMAGLPPLFGFISKELLYEAKTQTAQAAWLVTGAGVTANALFVALGLVAGIRPFWGRTCRAPRDPHEAPPAMWLGPAVLSGLGLVLGLFPDRLAAPLVGAAVSAVRAEQTEIKLALWHGLNPILALGAGTVMLGVGVYLGRNAIRRMAAGVRPTAAIGPDRLFGLGLAALNRVAELHTRVLQGGSLRTYLLVILCVAAGLTAAVLHDTGLLAAAAAPGTPVQSYEWILAALILAGALATALARSRLAAVAALGAVGYGVALIFILFGAPDLAMTQFVVETLTVILFVLVIYRLPGFARMSARGARVRDLALSLAVGAVMTVLVLSTTRLQEGAPISGFFAENSVPGGHGRNVVNVILVDFRAMDTLGEITVLAVAALGVAALLRMRAGGGQPAGSARGEQRGPDA